MDLIPLFPLSIVIFPGEKVNLHVFETRYRQLIAEADTQNITFCIPYVSDKGMQPICCELKLVEIVNKHKDGSSDITVEGIGLFKVEKYYKQFPGRLYPGAEGKRIKVDLTPNVALNEKIIPLLQELYQILKINNITLKDKSTFLTSDIFHKVGLTIEQEYEVLKITSEHERATYLLNHLIDFIEVMKRSEEVKEKAALNGHFKHLIPPM